MITWIKHKNKLVWDAKDSEAGTVEVWKGTRTGKWNATLVPATGKDVQLISGVTKKVAMAKARKRMRLLSERWM